MQGSNATTKAHPQQSTVCRVSRRSFFDFAYSSHELVFRIVRRRQAWQIVILDMIEMESKRPKKWSRKLSDATGAAKMSGRGSGSPEPSRRGSLDPFILLSHRESAFHCDPALASAPKSHHLLASLHPYRPATHAHSLRIGDRTN